MDAESDHESSSNSLSDMKPDGKLSVGTLSDDDLDIDAILKEPTVEITELVSEEATDSLNRIANQKSRKSRKSLTLQTKLEILRGYDEGQRKVELSRAFNLSGSTIRTVIMNRDRILEYAKQGTPFYAMKVKQTRSPIIAELERLLTYFILNRTRHGTSLGSNVIRQKALSLHEGLKKRMPVEERNSVPPFTASRGWLDRFKKRACRKNYGLLIDDDDWDDAKISNSKSENQQKPETMKATAIPVTTNQNATTPGTQKILLLVRPQSSGQFIVPTSSVPGTATVGTIQTIGQKLVVASSTSSSSYITPDSHPTETNEVEKIVVKVEPPDHNESEGENSFEGMSESEQNSSNIEWLPTIGNVRGSSSKGSDSHGRSNSKQSIGSHDASDEPPSKKKMTDDIPEDDDDLLFLKSLLPDLKRLPRQQNVYIRLKMQELVYNQVYGTSDK